MAVPATNGKQVIPPHFTAYLEKYRIYELFYDMASALAMTMPNDHILYLRNFLVDVAGNRDKSRIVIIGPPMIDKRSIAKAVGYVLKLPVISLCDFIKGNGKYLDNADVMASKFKEFLFDHDLTEEGWVLFDFPRNRAEVSALQKVGIRPSHAFQLIPSPENIAERELWDERFVGKPIKELEELMKQYRRQLSLLRPSVKNVLKEIPLRGRTLEMVAKNMAILGRQSNHSASQMLPRVVLIGTRGSFKRTIACQMSEILGVVHVNMDELIAQALKRDNQLGQNLRHLASRNLRLYGKMVVAVLENRLLDHDCLNKGWVLTGFPRDKNDFAVLDLFDTPPNRVIFITNNSAEALERVTNRRVNVFTGEYKHKDEVARIDDLFLASQFVIHPDDELRKVIRQQEEFDENVQGMLDYCKDNCIIVDGTGGVEIVLQRIFKSTLQASAPRDARKPDIDSLIRRKDDIDFEKKVEETNLAPIKSALQTTGKSKSQLKVEFTKKELEEAETLERSLKIIDASQPDSTKPMCHGTSLSLPSPSSRLLCTADQVRQDESCTSIFPREIQMDWGQLRSKVKSYISIPQIDQ